MRPTLAALLALLLALPACSQPRPEPPDNGVWFPYAAPTFATISRSATLAVVHADTTETLVYEQPTPSRDNPTSRISWIIRLSAHAPANTTLTLDADDPNAAARGWILEEIKGMPSHAAPLRGTITITQRSADALTGLVNIAADTDAPGPGQGVASSVRLSRRLVWDRSARVLTRVPEMDSRSGLDSLKEDDSD